MKYVPAFCDACSRSFLATVESVAALIAHPACPRCAGPSRLVPGAYYSEPHQLEFEELEAQLSRARIGAPQAQHLVSLLERATQDGELSRPALVQLIARFAGLAPLERALPDDGAGLLRAVGMLLTLLTPLATISGQGSGWRAAAQAPDPLFELTKKSG